MDARLVPHDAGDELPCGVPRKTMPRVWSATRLR